ncbi:class I SAM-dependent methyltransferase [Bacillus toyonensis]|uniref:class I SAM-dependent methyltransferase n=1 Tax=Bacillus toyonensis TaxID=155322 RepID=UPI0021B2C75F|nr:hypothetical protein [Bacillus toyonensis]
MKKKLHLGCGKDIKEDWVNLDCIALPGVDVVADLNTCHLKKLPFEEDSIDELLASYVFEHTDTYGRIASNCEAGCYLVMSSSLRI